MPNALPTDWPRISSALFYDDAPAAIDWLVHAFGFTVVIRVDGPDGDIAHSELDLGAGRIMVASGKRDPKRQSPRAVGGANTQALFVYVEDLDALLASARSAGARVITEPSVSDYGPEHWADRGCELEDPEGHRWWFAARLRNAAGAHPPTR